MKKQNGNVTVALLIVILIILLIVGVGVFYYVIYPQLIDKTNNENETTETEQVEVKQTVAPIAYEANYKYNFSKEYYYKSGEGYAYASDIVVPFININSEDGKKANNEISNLYKKLCDEYEKDLKDSEDIYLAVRSNYKTYYNGNIVSIVIRVERTAAAVVDDEYLIYNFDVNTLKNLTYKEVYQSLGYTDATVSEAVKKVINNNVSNGLGESSDGASYIEKSSEKYDLNVKENKLQYFIDKNGKLNIVTTLYKPAGKGEFNELLLIK